MTGRRGFLGLIGGGSALLAVGACSPPEPTVDAAGEGAAGPATGTPGVAAGTGGHVEVALTVHPTATEAAMDVLAEGGTAADAAVAVAAVLSVIEPYFSNIVAGETSLLYRTADGEVSSISAAGHVGSDYTVEAYTQRGPEGYGPYQALVPGAWQGWIELSRTHGRLGLERLLAPAIALARDGFTADAGLAGRVATANGFGGINRAAAPIYLPRGRPVAAGAQIRQPEFAATLQQLADVAAAADDREAGLQAADDLVYRGELAQRILTAVTEDGGYLTAEDLAAFTAQVTDSVTLEWDDDVVVHQNPPPSQGMTMLLALNTLRAADLAAGPDDPAVVHLEVEAMKLAMADRERWIGDPTAAEAPLPRMTSPEYGAAQLARIDPDTSLSWPIADGVGENTTTYQIVDGEGNAIAVTTSIGFQLIAAGDTGILLNNRMRFMTTADDTPNQLAPGRTVRYTGNPWLITRGDRLWLLGGAIGADVQSQVQTQHAISLLVHGRSVAETVEAPRWRSEHFPNSVVPHAAGNVLLIEDTWPQAVLDGLRARGQTLEVSEPSTDFGYATVVEIGQDGRSAVVGEDPRTVTSTGTVRNPR